MQVWAIVIQRGRSHSIDESKELAMKMSRSVWFVPLFVAALSVSDGVRGQAPAAQGQTEAATAPQGQRAPAQQMDPERAQRLYVSTDPKDHSTGYNFQRDLDRKNEGDTRYAQVTSGVVDYKKVKYRSRIGDLEIPAYLFQPLQRRGPKGHAAMVWVHG